MKRWAFRKYTNSKLPRLATSYLLYPCMLLRCADWMERWIARGLPLIHRWPRLYFSTDAGWPMCMQAMMSTVCIRTLSEFSSQLYYPRSPLQAYDRSLIKELRAFQQPYKRGSPLLPLSSMAITTIAIAVTFLAFLAAVLHLRTYRHLPLPPGPSGYPLVGNAFGKIHPAKSTAYPVSLTSGMNLTR